MPLPIIKFYIDNLPLSSQKKIILNLIGRPRPVIDRTYRWANERLAATQPVSPPPVKAVQFRNGQDYAWFSASNSRISRFIIYIHMNLSLLVIVTIAHGLRYSSQPGGHKRCPLAITLSGNGQRPIILLLRRLAGTRQR